MFAAFTANIASAQLRVVNNNACTFKIKVTFSNASCTGFLVPQEYTIPGNSTIGIVSTSRPYRITGAPIPIPAVCGSFDVTNTCGGPAGIQIVNCAAACGATYRVSLFNGRLQIT